MNRRSRHNRTGLGQVELIAIVAGIVLVVFVGISQLGTFLSRDIGQTAGGVGNPTQLVHHSRFTGQPYTPPDDGDNGGGNGDNGSGGNENNENGSDENNENENDDNANDGNNENENDDNANNENGANGGNANGGNNAGSFWSWLETLLGW
ncbi:MAG: hypothetical protein JW959_13070 [Pirellulales bacterium]|nr:hypothetical protein [Pirellulales bacterium]